MQTQRSKRSSRRQAYYQNRLPSQQDHRVKRNHHPETRVGEVGLGEDYYDEVGDAADRAAFYGSLADDFENGDGEQLFNDLNRLLKSNHTSLGYKQARRHLYGEIDRRPDGGLYYLYSGDGPKNESDFKEPAKADVTNYNCEHVVPQSWFRKKSVPKSDLHHLFTEQIQCNGSRSNYPLKDTPGGERITSCGIVKNKGTRSFEPNAGKGAVARATLYFITRYPGEVGDRPSETQASDLQQLLKWHKEYPVTDYERHRNDTIENVQGNRNPFIDFPALAEKVDFSRGFGR